MWVSNQREKYDETQYLKISWHESGSSVHWWWKGRGGGREEGKNDVEYEL